MKLREITLGLNAFELEERRWESEKSCLFFVEAFCEWLNLEKKKRIKKIKVKKCMGVGCVAKCVEESRERENRNYVLGCGGCGGCVMVAAGCW